MIPRYCAKADKCSYGKTHNPCDLHEDCPAFRVDTAKSFETLGQSKEKKSKYHNEKMQYDGRTFDSKWEMERYCELKLLEKAGRIKDLKCQERFVLIEKSTEHRETAYVADFTYYENGKLVVEDCKSKITKTSTYQIKKKLMFERYGIKIREIEK